MEISNEGSNKIWNAFRKYADTIDESLVAEFGLEELRITLYRYSKDAGYPAHEALKDHIRRQEDEQRGRRSEREKWKDRVYTGIISFFIGLVLGWIT